MSNNSSHIKFHWFGFIQSATIHDSNPVVNDLKPILIRKSHAITMIMKTVIRITVSEWTPPIFDVSCSVYVSQN